MLGVTETTSIPDPTPCHPCHPETPRSENYGAFIPSESESLEARILGALKSSPNGLTQEELTGLVSNSKGASNAMIETVLVRLMKGGEIGKINDRLVANP